MAAVGVYLAPVSIGSAIMLKALLWIILIIFVIGLLVVIGFFKLIF